MTRPPQVAQFLWIAGPLSNMEQLCLRSFITHGYSVHLYTYEKVTGVPAGVRIMNGEEILPFTRVFPNGKGFGEGSYTGFSNLFRYHLLSMRGGWWFDMDCVSIRMLPEPDGLWIASSFEGKWGTCANCCAIYAPPGHPVIVRLCAEVDAVLRSGNLRFGHTGPHLIQRIVREESLEACVAPWWEFTPYPQQQIFLTAYQGNRAWLKNWARQVKYFLWPCIRKDFRGGHIRGGTRALHLFSECWRADNRDKNARFHPACLYERLKRRHGVANSTVFH